MSAEFSFISPETYQPLRETKQLTYNPQFDVDAYLGIQHLRFTDPDEYTRRLEPLNGTTEFNLVTMLGERLNAAVSRRVDLIDEEGVMRDIHQGRPLIEWYEEGRLKRLELGSSPHDQLREKAEIVGQGKIEEFMSKAPVGALSFFSSRAGNEHLPENTSKEEQSIYDHYFIDAQFKQSKTEIVVLRMMSGLSMEETVKSIKLIKPEHQLSDNPDDIELLANPITLLPGESPISSLEELQDFLHRDLEDSLSEEEFELVKSECMPYIKRYLIIVENTNHVTNLLKKAYNAIVNKADEVVDALQRGEYVVSQRSSDGVVSTAEMTLLGSMPVRAVQTGCGFSGGFDVGSGNNSPFGVVDFSDMPQDESDSKGSRYFPCPNPGCNKINKRPLEGFLEACEKCGMSVRCDEPSEDELRKKRVQKEEREKELAYQKKQQEQQKKEKKPEEGVLVTLFSLLDQKEAA